MDHEPRADAQSEDDFEIKDVVVSAIPTASRLTESASPAIATAAAPCFDIDRELNEFVERRVGVLTRKQWVKFLTGAHVWLAERPDLTDKMADDLATSQCCLRDLPKCTNEELQQALRGREIPTGVSVRLRNRAGELVKELASRLDCVAKALAGGSQTEKAQK